MAERIADFDEIQVRFLAGPSINFKNQLLK